MDDMQTSTTRASTLSLDPRFESIAGNMPMYSMPIRDRLVPFAHGACVYNAEQDRVFVTSNLYPDEPGFQNVFITKCKRDFQGTWEQQLMIGDELPVMASSAVNYRGGMIFAEQGNMSGFPSALVYMSANEFSENCRTLLEGYHGRAFNSISDVVVHSDDSIWFVDNSSGFKRGFRPFPQLPNQVYCWRPRDNHLRVVADGFDMPSGLCFSPDELTLYVSDIGRDLGLNPCFLDENRPATMSVHIQVYL